MNGLTLITGATGYLGSRLAEKLAAQGPVRALVRKTSNTRALKELGVELIEGDLAEPQSFPAALAGVSRVFHAGAFVSRWTRTPELFEKINIDGTRALLDACLQAGVSNIVYTSSFIALGPCQQGQLGTEKNQHPGPFRNHYELTKKVALDIARTYFGKGLGLKIVFPGVIFGPGAATEANLVSGMIKDFLRKRFPLLGDGKGRWCYSFIEDVAEGHLLAASKGKDGGQYVLGGENLTMPQFLDMLERLTKVKKLPGRVPFWMGEVMGWLNERAAYFGAPVKLTPGEVRIFRQDWAFSSETAMQELGYRITPYEQAFQQTIESVRR